MQTKLTLRLERALIEAAKRYAEARGTSLSKLVAGYLDALTRTDDVPDDNDWKASLSPVTRQLVGLARPDTGTAGHDTAGHDTADHDEAAYHQYLEEKHSRHLRDTNV